MPIVPPQHDPPTHNFRPLPVPDGHREWLLVDSWLDFASRQPAPPCLPPQYRYQPTRLTA